MSDENCVFCKIVDGSILAKVLLRNDHVVAFADINPKAPAHALIVPVKHIPSVTDIGPESAGLVGEMVKMANDLADQLGVAQSGYRLVINCGPDAGQSVNHLHIHLLGGRKLAWPPG